MSIEQSIEHLAGAIEKLAAALGDQSAQALVREQKWAKRKTETFPDNDMKPETKPGSISVDQKKETTESPIKLETVRAKLAKIAQAGKQKEIKSLLTSFGVKKLSALPAAEYPELIKKADEIA